MVSINSIKDAIDNYICEMSSYDKIDGPTLYVVLSNYIDEVLSQSLGIKKEVINEKENG